MNISPAATMSTPKDAEEHDDDDMTPEEREAWLKSHGITIETPEDRKAAASGGVPPIILQLQGDDISEEIDGVELAFVPADTSKPIRPVKLPPGLLQPGTGDAAVDFVKPYFATNAASVDAELLKEQASKQFAGGNMEGMDFSKLTTGAMNAVASQGSVETFPLVRPADTNKYRGVYVYLDEVGLLKRLPTNPRATAIAESCGFNPPPTFHGDVFLGRCATRPMMANVDFVVGRDTDRGAEWMQRAISENLAWQQEMNKIQGKSETQPPAAGTEGKAVQETGFSFTQDDEEVEVTVQFDDDIDKKEIKVKFLPKSVAVVYQGEEALNLDLFDKVDVDGCNWQLDGKTNLVLTMEKAQPGVMWPRIKT